VLDELANPLGVVDIGLAARDGLEVVGIEQPRLKVVLEKVVLRVSTSDRKSAVNQRGGG
jgi:hypothetical protein